MTTEKEIVMAEYKGVEIKYSESRSKFVFGNKDGEFFEAATLKAAKMMIGRWGTAEDETKKQEPIQALELECGYGGTYRRFKEVTVTSFGRIRGWSNRLMFWVVGGHSRNRVTWSREGHYFIDTPKNRQSLGRVIELSQELEKIKETKEREIEAILKRLDRVKPTIPESELPEWKQ